MCDGIGFLIYFSSLLILIISVLLVKKNKFVMIISLFWIILLASLRGSAGVDTRMYIFRFENISDFSKIPIIESLLPFLMFIVRNISNSFSIFSLFYGAIISILYFYIFRKYPNSIYFGISIFSVIFIDSLYNVVRIGLALPLMFLAIVRSSKTLLFIAGQAHISTFLAFPLKSFRKYRLIICLILFIIFIYLFLILPDLPLTQRYLSKFKVYMSLSPRFEFSGISDTIGLWVALAIYYRVKGNKWKKWFRFNLISLILMVIFYLIVVNHFVFMLRVVRTYMIAIYALIAMEERKLDKVAFMIAFLFGLLYTSNFLRQIVASCSYLEGGFLPLHLTIY